MKHDILVSFLTFIFLTYLAVTQQYTSVLLQIATTLEFVAFMWSFSSETTTHPRVKKFVKFGIFLTFIHIVFVEWFKFSFEVSRTYALFINAVSAIFQTFVLGYSFTYNPCEWP